MEHSPHCVLPGGATAPRSAATRRHRARGGARRVDLCVSAPLRAIFFIHRATGIHVARGSVGNDCVEDEGWVTCRVPPPAQGDKRCGRAIWKLFGGAFPDRPDSVLARRARGGKMDVRRVDVAIGVRLVAAISNRSKVPKSVAERNRTACAHENVKSTLLGRKWQ
jgi:hypothetical protein